MKYIITICSLLLVNLVTGKEPVEIVVVNSGYVDLPELSFWMKGEDAKTFLDAMIANYPQKKRNGYKHKFKKNSVPPILGALEIEIYEGVQGTRKYGGIYFDTFESENYKQERLEKMTENETAGIIIYVRKVGAPANFIVTDTEAELFCKFIRNLCGS